VVGGNQVTDEELPPLKGNTQKMGTMWEENVNRIKRNRRAKKGSVSGN